MRPVVVAAGLFAAIGCAAGLRTAPTGPRPADAVPVPVDYPHPPAQIEKIDCDPGEPCVWVDGSYAWIGRRWEWLPGQWVEPVPGCYYRSPTLVWAPAASGVGTLYYFEPKWYPTEPRPGVECAPPVPCRGSARCSGALRDP